jgi:type IV pilus assembly protein PilW
VSDIAPAARHQESGFTLVEVLIALAISGIALGTMVHTFATQRQSYVLQEQVTEMTQNARAAMEVLTREIRAAGYNPSGAAFAGVPYNATQLQILADFDGNGDTTGSGENIIYSYDAASKQILRNAGAGNQPVADQIQSFTFGYLDGNGNPTTVTADIRQLALTIIARTARPDSHYTNNGGYRTYRLTSVVTLRN